MQLQWKESMIKAGQVIDALTRMFDEDIRLSVVAPNEKITIEGYQNGREHGYSFSYLLPRNGLKAFYICENRHSDDVRVYHGLYANYSLSDDAWKNARDFGAAGFEEAAKYICDTLIEEFRSHENE